LVLVRLFDNYRALNKSMTEINRCRHLRVVWGGGANGDQVAHIIGRELRIRNGRRR